MLYIYMQSVLNLIKNQDFLLYMFQNFKSYNRESKIVFLMCLCVTFISENSISLKEKAQTKE